MLCGGCGTMLLAIAGLFVLDVLVLFVFACYLLVRVACAGCGGCCVVVCLVDVC